MSTKIAELIPPRLRMSTGDRLRLVADIIEADPKAWDQTKWASLPDDEWPSITDIAGQHGIQCGTTCCIAGWSITVSPRSLVATALDRFDEDDDFRDALEGDDWAAVGAVALGLAPDLAVALFYDESNRRWMPDALRTLATLRAPRTLADAHAAGLTKIGRSK